RHRLNGVQEVGGSNPLGPTNARARAKVLALCFSPSLPRTYVHRHGPSPPSRGDDPPSLYPPERCPGRMVWCPFGARLVPRPHHLLAAVPARSTADERASARRGAQQARVIGRRSTDLPPRGAMMAELMEEGVAPYGGRSTTTIIPHPHDLQKS